VFNLYIIEGYSHKEIGEMLGISEGTSKSQLARARYLLQKMITETGLAVKQTSN
jgi:DNA-directed RNA polymerase specialized sigma24 family protein